MEFLLLLPLLLLMAAILFGVLVYPIVMIVRAACNESLRFKVGWILAMLLLWPLAQIFYGVWIESKRLWRAISWVLLVLTIATFLLLAFAIPAMHEETLEDSTRLMQQIEEGSIGTDAGIKKPLMADLALLREPLLTDSFWQWEQMQISSSLLDILQGMAQDNHISREEYESWKAQVDLRDLLDVEKL